MKNKGKPEFYKPFSMHRLHKLGLLRHNREIDLILDAINSIALYAMNTEKNALSNLKNMKNRLKLPWAVFRKQAAA